ncbi:TPA: DUF551 domain-containing protein [Klebsiella pneumoniae subsp. pneumoniae]|nr:DUF551 domain-containing protein [Klebsiella pneumoniae subsp. pneumoniae]
MTSKLTRDRLQEIAEDGFLKHGESKELARMALAAMDSEPVAEVVSIYGDPEAFGEREIRPLVGIQQMPYGTKLYRHAQPAPVVPEDIPDSVYEILCQACGGKAWMYVDALWNAFRAAMLQASPVCTCPSGDGSLRWPCPVHPGNSPVIPDGYVMVPVEPTKEILDEFDSIIDYGAEDSVDAWHRLLAAAPQSPGSEPATVPGKWIPVSERMPENDGACLCWDNRYVTTYAFIFGAWQANQFVAKNITHWMPLPATPQEVNRE